MQQKAFAAWGKFRQCHHTGSGEINCSGPVYGLFARDITELVLSGDTCFYDSANSRRKETVFENVNVITNLFYVDMMIENLEEKHGNLRKTRNRAGISGLSSQGVPDCEKA